MKRNSFYELQQRVIYLAESQSYQDALMQLEEAKTQFPKKIDRIGQWKANVYSLLEEDKKALNELEEVIHKGFWWNPVILENDPELDRLKNTHDFQKIITTCAQLYHQEKQLTVPKLRIEGNPNADKTIFSLHMRGSNTEDFVEEWQDPSLTNNYLMAFPQSSQLFSYNCYTWDDAEVAYSDVNEAFEKLTIQHSLDHKKKIIAGASQGADIALETCLTTFDFQGFILLIPSFKNIDKIENFLKNDAGKSLHGVIITGDQDPFYDNVMKVHSLFEKYNFSCRLVVQQGQGHVLPDNFPTLFQEAVEFILPKNKK
ncbi:hypothetical protein GCM10010954_23270 [Halobacillus andaensis]|uniref:BCE-2095-like N-terminal domain-containing protein n=1 Tax=Halobacillus andaensis TaxID=1176239 RepID=A0A917B770_HALAA|nr:hypothetical protein [Halobacillus andaensis]MBP2006082.1 putative esterase [Halobacillus andaensis]GGF23763.1 hypothetical protein GCM10010954_23270 [Halobacillus andaensis]